MAEPGFVVGGRYANAAGEYEVESIDGSMVRIRYANGFHMTLPAQGLWAQWETLVQQRMAPAAAPPRPATADRPEAASRAPATPRPTTTRSTTTTRTSETTTRTPKQKRLTGDAGFYMGAGYLALGCELTASVAGRDYIAFAQRYKILTGRSLGATHAGLDLHERPTHKMGAELSVQFPANADVFTAFEFGPGVQPQPAADPGRYTVAGTELVERLLRLGFDLGPNTDPAPIRGRVPEAHRPTFDRGISLRRSVRM